ncbi:MAG TPA: diguanylate cyclase [Spirochaetia bacterium]|nr:diguanylate cyclase [Spirochaetia bacterium]
MYKRKTDERLLQELLSQGYGVDERKKWREKWRRNLQASTELERRKQSRRIEPTPASLSPGGAALSEGKEGLSRAVSGEKELRRRAQDFATTISPGMRRRIDAYAYRGSYKVTGIRERFFSFLTIFFPRIKDNSNDSLIRLLVLGHGYRSDNPAAYCLMDNLDALYYSSRVLMGTYQKRDLSGPDAGGALGGIQGSIRRKEPFAFELFSLFMGRDEMFLKSLDYLRIRLAQSKRTEVQSLARIVRAVYRLALLTDGLDSDRLDEVFRSVVAINRAQQRDTDARVQIELAVNRFQVALSNLTEFKHQLFPVLLKLIGVFLREEDWVKRENRQRIFEFVDICDEEQLVHRQYLGKGRIGKDSVPVGEGVDSIEGKEGEKQDKESEEPSRSTPEKFSRTLAILGRVFPGSGIRNIQSWPVILPFFDLKVYNKSLTFPNHARFLSRHDPMGQIMVLHRILDNMIASLDSYAIDEILAKNGKFKQILDDISKEWNHIYHNLFNVYLKELNDYVRIAGAEIGGSSHGASMRKKIGDNLAQIRSLAVRHYGVLLIGTQSGVRHTSVRLYKLAEELHDLLSEIGEKMNGQLVQANDADASRILKVFTERKAVDFDANDYRPAIQRIKRYIEQKYRKSGMEVPQKSQLIFFELLTGLAGLYAFLLNERESYYGACEGKVFYAGDEDRKVWENIQESLSRMSFEKTEEDQDYTIDPATGLLSREYWSDDFSERFAEIRQRAKCITLLYLKFEGLRRFFETTNGEEMANHVLRCASDVILAQPEVRSRGSMEALRVAADAFLILIQQDCLEGALLAEALRIRQEEEIRKLPFYGEELFRDGPCGTLSIGVAQMDFEESFQEALGRAQQAAQEAGKTCNATFVSDEGNLVPFEVYREHREGTVS